MSKLLGPVEIRDLAEKLDVSPTKKWGQNFLHDPNTIRRIVAAADLSADDHVVAVGTGLGSSTLGLLAAGQQLTAAEVESPIAAERSPTSTWRAPEHADKPTLLHQHSWPTDAEAYRR